MCLYIYALMPTNINSNNTTATFLDSLLYYSTASSLSFSIPFSFSLFLILLSPALSSQTPKKIKYTQVVVQSINQITSNQSTKHVLLLCLFTGPPSSFRAALLRPMQLLRHRPRGIFSLLSSLPNTNLSLSLSLPTEPNLVSTYIFFLVPQTCLCM